MTRKKLSKFITKKRIAGVLYALDVPETLMGPLLGVDRMTLNQSWKTDPIVQHWRGRARKKIEKIGMEKIDRVIKEIEIIGYAQTGPIPPAVKLEALTKLAKLFGRDPSTDVSVNIHQHFDKEREEFGL